MRVGANAEALATLGVNVTRFEPGRRRFALQCLDAAEHTGHLAGTLGDSGASSLEARGWITRHSRGRDVDLTAAGPERSAMP